MESQCAKFGQQQNEKVQSTVLFTQQRWLAFSQNLIQFNFLASWYTLVYQSHFINIIPKVLAPCTLRTVCTMVHISSLARVNVYKHKSYPKRYFI